MTVRVVHDSTDSMGYVAALERKGNVIWAVGGHWGKPLVLTSESGSSFRRRKPPEVRGLRDVLLLTDKHAIVVGEGGAVRETKDLESWRTIETGFDGCLFAIERALGTAWLGGDKSFVLASADGETWRKPDLGPELASFGRIQRIVSAGGALWFTSFSGKLGVVRNDRLEIADLTSARAVTGVAFSPRGTGIVVGDGGTLFRSTSRGRSWMPVESGVEDDLEDVIWHDGLFIVPGAHGKLLVSADGETFDRVDLARDDHLWCALGAPDGVLLGGDAGLLLHVSKEALAAGRKRAPSRAISVGASSDQASEPVDTALVVGDGSVLARTAGSVERVREGSSTAAPGVTAFGRSANRAHWAMLVGGDRIEVKPGVDRAAHTLLDLPRHVGAVSSLEVFPGGDRVLVVTDRGVWALSERGCEPLHEATGSVHAAVSSDGQLVACGSADSAHLLFRVEATRYVLCAEIDPHGTHPRLAVFGQTHVCLCADDTVLGVDLGFLAAQRKNPYRVGEASAIVTGHVVSAGRAWGDGYVLGDASGSVFQCAEDGEILASTDVGSAVLSLDADAEVFLAGTVAGDVVEVDALQGTITRRTRLAPRRDPRALR